MSPSMLVIQLSLPLLAAELLLELLTKLLTELQQKKTQMPVLE
jgi:hypothetical protein